MGVPRAAPSERTAVMEEAWVTIGEESSPCTVVVRQAVVEAVD